MIAGRRAVSFHADFPVKERHGPEHGLGVCLHAAAVLPGIHANTASSLAAVRPRRRVAE